MMQVIKTDKAPAPIGPYSQAIRVGDTVYISGQIAINPETGAMEQESLAAETHRVMKNIAAVLEAAELDFSRVVKCSIFLLDMADFATVNEIYGSYFANSHPVRETVAVVGLPKNARVEISCIADKSGW